jgi:hypothetical protein
MEEAHNATGLEGSADAPTVADGPTCPACTVVNKVGALCCSVCSTVFEADGISCPRCTFSNSADAERCVACDLVFEQKAAPWSCSTCASKDAAFVFLDCAHKACVPCHTAWIASCDERNQEPTCLECVHEEEERAHRRATSPAAATARATPRRTLSAAAIRTVLGDDAMCQREQRQLSRVAQLTDCPTPDCANRFELEEGVSTRWTRCGLCGQHVELGTRPDLSSLLPPSAARLPSAAALPSAARSASGAGRASSGRGAGRGSNGRGAVRAMSGGGGGHALSGRGAGRGLSGVVAASGASADEPISLSSSASSEGSEASGIDDEDVPLSQRAAAHKKQTKGGERTSGAAVEAERRALLSQPQYRVCPGCRNGIEKDPDSCDKFQCTCGCRFCWKCGTRADERGQYACKCTGDDHVAWDNVRNRPAPRTVRQGGTKRPREV